VNTLLGIIVALVGFQIVRTWARGLPRGAPPESAASAAPAPAPEPREKGKRGRGDKAVAQQTPAMLVAAITEKELFDPSRQPPSVENTTAASVPVTQPPDNVTVVGVRIFGKDREAFVTDGTQGQAVTRRGRRAARLTAAADARQAAHAGQAAAAGRLPDGVPGGRRAGAFARRGRGRKAARAGTAGGGGARAGGARVTAAGAGRAHGAPRPGAAEARSAQAERQAAGPQALKCEPRRVP